MQEPTPQQLRERFAYTCPSVITRGPIFGFGYRSAHGLGNLVHAQVAKQFGLSVMLAQQSARELERTGRTFQHVVDTATISAYKAGLTVPWGADGDHLRTAEELTAAVNAGCTHFTYDVSSELRKGMGDVIAKVANFHALTEGLLNGARFTCEVSLDETPETTRLGDIAVLVKELGWRGIRIHEIAPRFPGHFEKGTDYFSSLEAGRRVCDLLPFQKYARQLQALAAELGFRVCVHSGSDKFSLYPILADIFGAELHIKTAGTYYLEELKIVARHDPNLFREIFRFSFDRFQKDRTSYELSTDTTRIPALGSLNGDDLARLMTSGSGNDDMRQVLHVTYGSVLTDTGGAGKPGFSERIKVLLEDHFDEYMQDMQQHLQRHIKDFLASA